MMVNDLMRLLQTYNFIHLNLPAAESLHPPDYDDYDDVYGRSVDDDTCISPTDASEFLYNRNHPKPGNLGTFLVKEDQNEDEDDPMEETKRRNSETFRMPPQHRRGVASEALVLSGRGPEHCWRNGH